MSEFNFGNLANTQVSASSVRHLKPYTITKVKWDGAELTSGTAKTGKDWKCLILHFVSDEGVHDERVFIPDHTNPKDVEDTEVEQPNGGKKVFPSNAKYFMQLIAHIAGILNPEGFAKMQAASAKFRSFDDMVKAFIQVTDKVKGKETNLKLVHVTRDGSNYAAFPRSLGVNSKGETFPINIIGEDLFFSNYEEGKRKELANAKPTKMKSSSDDIVDTVSTTSKGSEDEDLNFDDLGL
jgi:hypothetical protein